MIRSWRNRLFRTVRQGREYGIVAARGGIRGTAFRTDGRPSCRRQFGTGEVARTPPYTSYRTFKTFIEDLHEQRRSVAHRPQRADAFFRRGRHSVDARASVPRSHCRRRTPDPAPQGACERPWRGALVREALGTPSAGIRPDVRDRPRNRDPFAIQRGVPEGIPGRGRGRPEVRDVLSLRRQRCGRENKRPRPEGPEAAVSDAAQEDAGPRLRPRRHRDSKPRPARPNRTARIEGKKPSEILLMHLDPNEMDDEQQAAVWTLLKYFKSKGM